MAGRMQDYKFDPNAFAHFDPDKSARFGLKILIKSGARFALAGRIAVWAYVPPNRQVNTKDVDFAVPHEDMPAVLEVARACGKPFRPLEIGGIAFRLENVWVDFIDRYPELGRLFAAAVAAANEAGAKMRLGGRRVPVVPKEFLIAMKVATMQEKDDRDAESLILSVPDKEYPKLRSLVRKYLGPVGALRLDDLARKAGHPGPGKKPYYG